MFTAIIDADSIIYKIGFAIEDKVIWNENEVESGEEDELIVDYTTDLEQCYNAVDQLIDNIMFATCCDQLELVFTGSGNFRYDNKLGYKANRKNTRKPTGYKEILDYLLTTYPSVYCEGYEADDYVVWKKYSNPEEYVLCAIDKDVLYQTEGVHYNYGKDEDVKVTQFEATRFAYYQTLTGDVTDGYKGCPGIGPVKADKVLANCKTEQEMWDAVVLTYESKKLEEEDAIATMQLANMRQFDGKTITLWLPSIIKG